jgi:hypothetical protein
MRSASCAGHSSPSSSEAIHAGAGSCTARPAPVEAGLGHVLELHQALAAEQQRLRDHRLELAHVPRPRAVRQARQRARAESGDRQAEALVQPRAAVLGPPIRRAR